MTLTQLVCRAASAYPDGAVLEYFDARRERPAPGAGAGGDALAAFVARELCDTFDPGAGDTAQVAAAALAMQAAADDLAAVAHAIADIGRERAAA